MPDTDFKHVCYALTLLCFSLHFVQTRCLHPELRRMRIISFQTHITQVPALYIFYYYFFQTNLSNLSSELCTGAENYLGGLDCRLTVLKTVFDACAACFCISIAGPRKLHETSRRLHKANL